MADISQEINDFKNAIYGEEVRGSMISLAEKINTEVDANTTNVNQAVSTANNASSAANQAVADANTTLQAANQAVTSAEGSASAAAGSASAAAGHAEDAKESATAAAGSASAAAQSAADAAEVAEGLGGFNGSASSVTAQDVEGLHGTPGEQSNVQALIDAIAEQVLNQLVKKSQIINNLLATQAGNVLDATQGKALKDLIDRLNSDSGWLTISTPYEPIRYRKSGKIVEFYFWNDKTIPISTDIATIPDGYRPSIPSYPNTIFILDAYGGGGRIEITNEGIVISSTEISGKTWSFFVATWICD